MTGKSELEKIVRKLVEDVREAIITAEKEKGLSKRKSEEFSAEAREQLLEKLLANERILTLIYDKTFYSTGNRVGQEIEIPNELKNILEDQESEGFD